MKTRLLFLLLFTGFMSISQAQVSINEDANDPHASAMLDVSSTDKGLLIPRMTAAERIAINNPANGLIVFDTSSNTFWFYSLSTNQWEEMGGAIVSVLNDLMDAKTDANSIYIGTQTAINDDGDNFNVAIGRTSMMSNTSGTRNTAIGYAAMKSKTIGDDNTAIGSSAFEKNSNGFNNTVLGSNALHYNTTGNNNVAIGRNAMNISSGSSHTVIGSGAGSNSSSTYGSIFIGYEAGKNESQSNKLYIENSGSYLPLIGGDFDTDEVQINGTLAITGGNPVQGKVLTTDDNGNATWEDIDGGAQEINELNDAISDANSVYVGAESGINDNGDNYNTAFGQQSLKENISGVGNTAVGLGSLRQNISGKENTALGAAALLQNKTGENNVAVGYSALGFSNIAGSDNVAIGDRSLLMNAGSENTALGKGAGQNSNDNASGNVFIGYEAGKEEVGSNKLYIENSDSPTPLIGGDFDTDRVNINGELNVQDELKIFNEATIYGNLITLTDINAQKNLVVNDSITTSNIKITSGNPVAGKVLTTDDNGNASWEEVSDTGAQEINDLNDAKTMFKSIFIGENSGQNESGNNSNTAIGFQTLLNNTTGGANNVLGREALMSNTNGDNNTALGYKSQFSNTSGGNNTAIGNNTLYHNTGGNYNTAIGNNAGKGSEGNSISGGVFIGNSAGYNETEDNKLYIENSSSSTPLIGGDFSTDEVVINGTLQITGGIPGEGKVLVSDADGKASWSGSVGPNGIDDLSDAKNDNSSIFIGSTGELDDGANKNTAVGNNALNVNEIGEYNSAFGLNALKNNNSGMHNTAMGYSSMEFGTNGIHNTAIGSGALYYNGTGSQNTALGFEAGFGSYGSNSMGNVFLGYKAGYNETENNKLYISNSDTQFPLIYGDFGQNKLEVNGEFKVVTGALSNVKINNEKLESSVPIEANSSVEIAQTLDVNGNLTANDLLITNDRIIANGDIEAHENIILSDEKNISYETPRTQTLQMHPSSFIFADSYAARTYNANYVKIGGTDNTLYAPLQLPEGARIIEFEISSFTNYGSNISATINKITPLGDNPAVLATIYEEGSFGGFNIAESNSTTDINDDIVSNTEHQYYIEIIGNSSYISVNQLYGVKIIYTVSTLNH